LTSAHCALDTANKDSETALHWALRTGVRGLNSARVLVEDGAKTSLFNKTHRRALDVAGEGFGVRDFPLSPEANKGGGRLKGLFKDEGQRKPGEREEARANLFACEVRGRTRTLR
jgi:hypothetical protein